MTAKSVTGILIITLNVVGIFFIIAMRVASFRQTLSNRTRTTVKVEKPGRPHRIKTDPMDPEAFNKADYLLDDMDLSEFDDLDLDDKV